MYNISLVIFNAINKGLNWYGEALIKIYKYICWKLFYFRYEKRITEVLDFIRVLKGEEYITEIDKKKGIAKVKSGMKNISDFIFSAGDCARFAKILAITFKRYRPKILLVKYSGSKSENLWDHALVDFGGFYADVKGIWLKNIAKIRFDFDRVYHIKRLDAPVLKGNMHSAKFMGNLYTHRIRQVDIWAKDLNTDKPKILGYNIDKLDAYVELFKHQNDPNFLEQLNTIDNAYRQADLPKISGFIKA